MKRAGLAVVAALLFACPKSPTAVLTALEKPDDVAAMRDAFNADAAHRRVLVLLSPH